MKTKVIYDLTRLREFMEKAVEDIHPEEEDNSKYIDPVFDYIKDKLRNPRTFHVQINHS